MSYPLVGAGEKIPVNPKTYDREIVDPNRESAPGACRVIWMAGQMSADYSACSDVPFGNATSQKMR